MAAGFDTRITLCVCTYDRYETLGRAIASLAAQTLPKDQYDILVVDNSPNPDRAEAYGRSLTEIANLIYVVEEKPGLANARNVATGVAETPLIAYIDDDALASRDWAREIVSAFETFGPECSMVAGAVDPIWGAPRPPWLHEAMHFSLSLVDWGGDAARPARKDELLVGANMAFRVEAIRRHGGFDVSLGRMGSEETLASNEELALEAKIRAAREMVIWAPRARVRHLIPESRLQRTWFRRRMAWQAVSDFKSDPRGRTAEAKREWPRVARFFNLVPPLYRTMRGLYFDTDDPDVFHEQLRVLYLTTLAALAGFPGVEGD